MPSGKTTKAALEAEARMPTIPKEIIDQFVTGPMTATAVNDLSIAFRKALIERALSAEQSHHLGYPPGADKPQEADNFRNGATGPLQCMPVFGVMDFELVAIDKGARLTYRYSVAGPASAELEAMASPVDAVQGGQLKRLLNYLEGNADLRGNCPHFRRHNRSVLGGASLLKPLVQENRLLKRRGSLLPRDSFRHRAKIGIPAEICSLVRWPNARRT